MAGNKNSNSKSNTLNHQDYLEMSSDELNKIHKITQAILKDREQIEVYAIQMCDAKLLTDSLKHHPDRKLNKESWDYMELKHVSWENRDFIDLVMSLPEFEKQQKKFNRSPGGCSWTEELISQHIADVRFVEYFYHHPKLHSVLERAIKDEEHLHANITEPTIQFLLDNKLIIWPKDLLSEVLHDVQEEQHVMSDWVPYISYGIKHNCLNAAPEQFVQLYEKYAFSLTGKVCRHIQNHYLTENPVSFDEIMQGNSGGHPAAMDSYSKSLIKFQTSDFSNLISFHALSQDSIKRVSQPLINVLSSKSASDESEKELWQNLIALIQVVKSNQPEHMPFLKECLMGKNASKAFKEEIEKLFLYVKLDASLGLGNENSNSNSLNQENKTLKI